MNTKLEQFPATNPNPVLTVEKGGTVLYSNTAGESLLHEWGVVVGKKLPSYIIVFVQRVISRNSPEKLEVKVGNRVYVISFHPLPKEECVNIYGFDVSDHKEFEEKLRESEKKYHGLFENMLDGFAYCKMLYDDCGNPIDFIYLDINSAFERLTGLKEVTGKRVTEVIPGIKEQHPELFDAYSRVALTGQPERFEIELKSLGMWLWVSVYSTEREHFVAVFDNITERKRMEEALRESEAKLNSLFESLPIGISILDKDRNTIFTNPYLESILDMSTEELANRVYDKRRYIHVDGSDFAISDMPSTVALNEKRSVSNVEVGVVKEDCSRIWTSVNAVLLPYSDWCVVVTTTDITERKKAEEALKKAHESLEAKVKERTSELEEAQRMAHIGNWVWDIATDKAYWSDELYHIFGRNPQEFAPTYYEYLNYAHPDDRDYADNAHKGALNGKSFSIDHRIILANGEVRTVHIQTEVIFDGENVPIRLKGTVQDITERKRIEEQLRYLANIVESSNDAIGTMSLDGIITNWNKGAEQVYGYSAEEILGKPISTLAPPHLDKETTKRIEIIKQGDNVHQYETSRLRKDGKTINVSITLSPVLDMHGKLTDVSFNARDITERKKVEEKLRESEEKYRNIVETANESISIIDSRGIVTFANKKLWDMLGYSVEESINKSAYDLIEDAEAFKRKQEDRLKGVSDTYELKAVRKDGSKLWVLASVKPLFNEKGEYIGSLGMFTDITKRKEAEEALKNLEIARKKEIHHRIKNNLQVISSLLDLQAEQFSNRECINDSEVLRAFRESQDRVTSMALIHEELYRGGETDKLDFSSYIKELVDNLFLTYMVGNKDISLKMDLMENAFFDMDTAIPLGIIINELVSNSLKYAFVDRDKGEIRISLHKEETGGCKSEDISTPYVLSFSDNGVGIPEDINIEDLDSLGLQLVISLVEQLDGELELKRDNGTEFTIRFTVTENNTL